MDEQTLLQQGIAAARAGDRARARQLLQRALQLNRHNETAWLWLSAVLDDPRNQAQCLENVLRINPHNAAARRALEKLQSPTTLDDLPVSQPIAASLIMSASARNTPSSLVCPQCSAENKPDARFCDNCRQPLPAVTSHQYRTKPAPHRQSSQRIDGIDTPVAPRLTKKHPQPNLEQEPTSRRRNLMIVGFAFLTLVVLSACGLTCWFAYQRFVMSKSDTTLATLSSVEGDTTSQEWGLTPVSVIYGEPTDGWTNIIVHFQAMNLTSRALNSQSIPLNRASLHTQEGEKYSGACGIYGMSFSGASLGWESKEIHDKRTTAMPYPHDRIPPGVGIVSTYAGHNRRYLACTFKIPSTFQPAFFTLVPLQSNPGTKSKDFKPELEDQRPVQE